MSAINKWQSKQITINPNETYIHNMTLETANIIQLENRKAVGGTSVFVDTESNVSSASYLMKVDEGSSQLLVRPFALRVIYFRTSSASPILVTITEIESDELNFAYNSANSQSISGNVQVQEPITIDGSVSILGNVEVTNDSGNPLPVSGTVGVNNFPATQAVSGTVSTNVRSGALTNRSGTITVADTSQEAVPINAARKFLFIQNMSVGDLWINFGIAANKDQPSIKLTTNEKLIFTEFVPTESVTIIGATLAQAFTIKEA